MSNATPASCVAKMLLAGPRGRRFLLEYALASELAGNPARTERTFGYAAVRASFCLTPGERSTSALFGWRDSDERLPEVTPAEVAEHLNVLELQEPTSELLRKALTATVGNARPWQAPDGQDVLAATSEMHLGLQRVANHVAASSLTDWWCTPIDVLTQHAVMCEGAPFRPAPGDAHTDPDASWGDEWWSHPPQALPSSTRVLFDGSPAGLWFVEDSLEWEGAESMRLIVPKDASVFEITGAVDWTELCARFPFEVTAQKLDDWHHATAPSDRWVIPDWVQVAEHYDAVHLQVGAYLAAAGTTIPIDDSSGFASLIAGWNPDQTYWFSSTTAYDSERILWTLQDDGVDMVWKSESAPR